AKDVPAVNDVSPVAGDDPLFAAGRVEFHGQVVFAVVALTRDAARRAVAQAILEIDAETPLVSVDDALAANADIMADYAF
ncbi:hypothetical protein, partial [Serratia marcescens]|uniref:hypothetical protein n=1 Tax=Serratia marcescens TaxID=615 RepID=UPI001953585D